MIESKLLSPEELECMPDGTPLSVEEWRRVRAHIAALEADNAALLTTGNRIHDLAQHDEACKMLVGSEFAMCDCAMGDWQQLQRAPHPGAALLEEHRKALEAKDALWREYKASKDADVAAWKKERDDAISALEPLQGVAAALAEEMERAVEAKERPKGGQQVPFHGDFASCPPSMVGRLRWWARELRTALGGAHGKALVRARNDGLEKGACVVDCRCTPPEGFDGEWHHMACTVRHAERIRAMKEPEE